MPPSSMPPSRFKRKSAGPLAALAICATVLLLMATVVWSIFGQPQMSRAQVSQPRVAVVERAATSPDASEAAEGLDWLTLGDHTSKVSELKAKLQQLGYAIGDRSRYFNAATQQAVLQFQQDAGISIDGIVGTETKAALAQALDEKINTTPDTSRPQSPPDIERITARGKLIVAILNKENPPFFMTDRSGELVGSDIVLAQELAEQLGVELEFNRSARTFNDVVRQVYDLEADIAISKISRTLKRAKSVSFSHPYLTMRQGLLINRVQFAEQSKGENVAETLRTLEGKVGVIRGSSYVGFVKQKFPKATVAEFSTWPEVVRAVTQGKVLAAYRDELEVKKIVRNNPDAALQFQTVALTDTQDPLSIVLPWDSHTLQDFVNQYLDAMHPDDTVDSLLDRYIEQV